MIAVRIIDSAASIRHSRIQSFFHSPRSSAFGFPLSAFRRFHAAGRHARPAGRTRRADVGVFDQRRGVVGFDSRVDDERTPAAPVFVVDECADAVDVDRRGWTRVNVTHRKLLSERATNSLSSTRTISGNCALDAPLSSDRQNRSTIVAGRIAGFRVSILARELRRRRAGRCADRGSHPAARES